MKSKLVKTLRKDDRLRKKLKTTRGRCKKKTVRASAQPTRPETCWKASGLVPPRVHIGMNLGWGGGKH